MRLQLSNFSAIGLRWWSRRRREKPHRTAPETRPPGPSAGQSNCEILQFTVLGFDLLVQLDQPLADLDAGQQFMGLKRLGEVVICAGRPVSRKHSLPLSNPKAADRLRRELLRAARGMRGDTPIHAEFRAQAANQFGCEFRNGHAF